MAEPQLSHTGAEFYGEFKDLLQLSRRVFRNERGFQFAFSGSGTVGMESAIVSAVSRGDRVLVIDTGYFGRRMALLNQIHGAKVDEIDYQDGKHARPEDLRKKLAQGKYKAVFITHVDTATSISNPVAELVAECKRAGVFSIVDCVCSIGGVEFDFDRLGADIAFTASQKAIAGPPGVTMLAVSNEMMAHIENRKEPISSYYMSLLRWKPVMEDPKIYLTTPTIQVLRAVRVALIELEAEGLPARWARHSALGTTCETRLSQLGADFVADAGHRAETVTSFWVRDGTAADIQRKLEQERGIVVARGVSENRDRMIRIGHFGILKVKQLTDALDAIGDVLSEVGALKTKAAPLPKRRRA